MLITKHLVFIYTFLIFTTVFANDKVKICYYPLREEIVTAALLSAKENNFFTDQGLVIEWLRQNPLSATQMRSVFEKSNFNQKSSEYLFNGVISEAAIMHMAKNRSCDVVSTTVEAAFGSGVDLSQFYPAAVYRYGKDYDAPVVVRPDSKIKNIKDLKGKRVRINQVASLIPFEALLKEAGLTPADVKYEKVILAKIPEALEKKNIDVVLSYNPTVPLLIGSNKAVILIENLFENYYKSKAIPHSLLLVTKEFLSREKTYNKFMEAFKNGAKFIAKNPESIVNQIPFLKKTYSKAEIEKSRPFLQISFPSINNDSAGGSVNFIETNNFDFYQKLLIEKGFLKKSVDLSSWNK